MMCGSNVNSSNANSSNANSSYTRSSNAGMPYSILFEATTCDCTIVPDDKNVYDIKIKERSLHSIFMSKLIFPTVDGIADYVERFTCNYGIRNDKKLCCWDVYIFKHDPCELILTVDASDLHDELKITQHTGSQQTTGCTFDWLCKHHVFRLYRSGGKRIIDAKHFDDKYYNKHNMSAADKLFTITLKDTWRPKLSFVRTTKYSRRHDEYSRP